MMPTCYYSKKMPLFTWHCSKVADHVEVIDGRQIAACDRHEHWMRKEILKEI